MLSKKMEAALNGQIAYEAHATTSYLSMASWCEKQGLPGCAEFFYAQSDEERMHMLKIVRFVNECGGHALIPKVDAPPNDYKSLEDAFKAALKQEQEVTKQIHNLTDLALKGKDFPAFQFLQWFVEEQVEEEAQFSGILDMIAQSGKGPLFLLDRAIAQYRGQENEKSTAETQE